MLFTSPQIPPSFLALNGSPEPLRHGTVAFDPCWDTRTNESLTHRAWSLVRLCLVVLALVSPEVVEGWKG